MSSLRVPDSIQNAQRIETLRAMRTSQNRLIQQVATGQRLASASDDPAAARRGTDAGRALQQLDHYDAVLAGATTRLRVEQQVAESLQRIAERLDKITVAGGGTADAAERANLASETQALMQQYVALGNTMIGDQYVFGGGANTVPPFSLDGSGNIVYAGDTRDLTVDLASGVGVVTGRSGDALFGQTGMATAMAALRDSLRPPATNATTTALLPSISAVRQATRANVADVGTRYRQVETLKEDGASLRQSLVAQRDDALSADLAETLSLLMRQQTSYKAYMQASSQAMDMTLGDYLR